MKVRVVVPTSGTPQAVTVSLLSELCTIANIPQPKYIIGNLSAADTRNKAVKWFMEETDEDFLIMIDDDIIPSKKLLSIIEHNLPIVGCPYLMNNSNFANYPVPCVLLDTIDNGKHTHRIIDDPFQRAGIVECDAIGTGALCIMRDVFTHIKPAFEFRSDEWGVYEMGEDIDFCVKAKKYGYKIYADFDRSCEHFQRVRLLQTMIAMQQAIT